MTDTKAVNLTEDEIVELLRYNGMKLYKTDDQAIERINYLNKRLKAFREVEVKGEETLKMPPSAATGGWSNG